MEKSLDGNTRGQSTLSWSSKNLRELVLQLLRAAAWLIATLKYGVLIEHRKLNDHSIEVEPSHITSLQRHCEFSTLKGFRSATLIGQCQFAIGEVKPDHFQKAQREADRLPYSNHNTSTSVTGTGETDGHVQLGLHSVVGFGLPIHEHVDL